MDLKEKIIELLKQDPKGLKAKVIAKKLQENTTRINSILYSYNQEFIINDKFVWIYSGDGSTTEIRKNENNSTRKSKRDQAPYHYYNCNPRLRFTDDCVVRSICTLMGEPWDKIMIELAEHAIETGYMLNTPENYGDYLEKHGYLRQHQPVHRDGTKMKFKEFVAKFDGHAVVHCGKGHVTYVADNAAWDVWDVSNEIVGVFWCEKSEEQKIV